jgi:general secretion pathway protein K
MCRQAGFALLIVLWTVALLALIGTAITSAARSAAARSAELRAAAEAQAAADGLAREAMYHLIDQSNAGHWTADGVLRPVRLARGSALIRVSNEDAKVDPNTASAEMLSALMVSAGVDAATAKRIGPQIVSWHQALITGAAQYRAAGMPYGPPHQRFYSVDEVRLVLGITPMIFDRIAPYLSVFSDSHLDLSQADPVVIRAAQQAGRYAPPPPDPNAPLAVSIDARVTLPDGAARRHVALQFDLTSDDPNSVFYILAWD